MTRGKIESSTTVALNDHDDLPRAYPSGIADAVYKIDTAAMAEDVIVCAPADPDPGVDPDAARRDATVVATGRSDQPNRDVFEERLLPALARAGTGRS